MLSNRQASPAFNHPRSDTMLNSVNDLTRAKVTASDGDLGPVKAAFFDDRSWVVRYLVVNTGSWLSGREVLISGHRRQHWRAAGLHHRRRELGHPLLGPRHQPLVGGRPQSAFGHAMGRQHRLGCAEGTRATDARPSQGQPGVRGRELDSPRVRDALAQQLRAPGVLALTYRYQPAPAPAPAPALT